MKISCLGNYKKLGSVIDMALWVCNHLSTHQAGAWWCGAACPYSKAKGRGAPD